MCPVEKKLLWIFSVCCFVLCAGLVPHSQHYHHPGGPGLGVRMNSGWQPPKMTPIRYGPPASTDREVAKLEKFKALLAEPNLDMGQ